jgi:hypothetical protein
VWSGPDDRGELGLDKGLVDGLGGLTDAVINLRSLECVQDLQQCRLVKGHRALCPFASTIAVVSLTIARWPLRGEQPAHRALLPTPPDGTPLWIWLLIHAGHAPFEDVEQLVIPMPAGISHLQADS